MDGHSVVATLHGFFQHYGYFALVGMLLLENAGLPVPGETSLLLAAVLARSEQMFKFPTLIVVATLAAAAGDNLGYLIGHWGGRRLLDKYAALGAGQEAVRSGERLFARHGAVAIFFARFIAGARVIAGPVAGALRMPWHTFVVFNALGAVAWVTVIVTAGYMFGRQLPRLLALVHGSGLLLAAVLIVALVAWWWIRRGRTVGS